MDRGARPGGRAARPGRGRDAHARRRARARGVLAFVVYNTSTTVFLAWAGAADGWLLWPVVGLHGILAVAVAVGAGLLPGTDRRRSS
jgi:hypothetical protein